jgi:hypothetical protein
MTSRIWMSGDTIETDAIVVSGITDGPPWGRSEDSHAGPPWGRPNATPDGPPWG